MLEFGCAVEELRDRRVPRPRAMRTMPGQRTRARSDMQVARKRIRRWPANGQLLHWSSRAGRLDLSHLLRYVLFLSQRGSCVPVAAEKDHRPGEDWAALLAEWKYLKRGY
jgi:hypothetical protein